MEEQMRTIVRLFLRIELLFFIRHSHVCIWHLKRFEDYRAEGGGYECPDCFNARSRIANCWFRLLRNNRRYFFKLVDEQVQAGNRISPLCPNAIVQQKHEIEQGRAEVRDLLKANSPAGVQ